MMDRDYRSSPRQVKVTIIGILVMAIFGVALFGGLIPGLKPNYNVPSTITYDGRPYYYSHVPVPWPALGANFTQPLKGEFHNVTLWYWVTSWYSITGGYLRGNVTLTNDSTYAFVLGGPETSPAYNTSFVTPGGGAGVFWSGGFSFLFLVLAPSSATGTA
jgi:hypothetical protein